MPRMRDPLRALHRVGVAGALLAFLLGFMVVLIPGASASVVPLCSQDGALWMPYDHSASVPRVASIDLSPRVVPQRATAAPGDCVAVSCVGVAANSVDDVTRLTTSQQRSLRSLQSQVETHQAKLDAYRANPDAYDNLGILERAPTPEIRQSIIDGRIRHLETEIRTFQDQFDKLLGGE